MKKLAVVVMLAMLAVSCAESKEDIPVGNKSEEAIHIAKVNKVPITSTDIKDEFNMLPVQLQQMFMREDGLEDLLDELIKKEMLYQEAKKKGITSSKKFRERKAELKKRLMEEFKKQEEFLTNRLTIELLLEDEVDKKSAVEDREVREYYDSNIQDFVMEVPDQSEPQTIEFDAVKDRIRQHLVAKKQEEVFDSYIATLKESYNIAIDRDAFSRAFGNIAAPPREQGEGNPAVD
jgi:hypothetical protein